MLLRHSLLYLLARGLPGLINFLAVSVYTRILNPEEYGRYALIIAGVGFFNVLFFQWLRLALLRFLPRYQESPEPLLSTVLAGFRGLCLATGLLGMLVVLLWPDRTWKGLLIVGIPLLWSQAWFELNLELQRSRLQPGRYGLMSAVKALSFLVLGWLAVRWGLGAYGPLLGLLVGFLFASLLWGRSEWEGTTAKASEPLLWELLRYGAPLATTFALTFVVNASDRFLISWFLGEGPAGVYAASYDLTDQTLTLLMVVVNLAAYPLAVRALETEGDEAAKRQLQANGEVLLGVTLPSTVGLVALAPDIATILLGPGFRDDAARLIPLVAVAAFLSGVRAYHFDLAFQLGRRTVGQVWVMGGAALLNILLNLWWIPLFGLMGAAWATLASYALAVLLSVLLGRRIFMVPFDWKSAGRVTLATGVMLLFLRMVRAAPGLPSLLLGLVGGTVVYAVCIVLLDVHGVRAKLLGLIGRFRLDRG